MKDYSEEMLNFNTNQKMQIAKLQDIIVHS